MRTTIVVCVVFILTFLGVVFLLGYSTDHVTEQTDQEHQTAETYKKDDSTLHKALSAGFIRVWELVREYREDIVAVGTVFIAAFTVILGFATAALYTATRDLVRGAELTAERQLRAYILVAGKDLVEQGGNEERFIHRFEIKNTGSTPAYKLWMESVTLVLPHPLPANFAFTIEPPGIHPSVMMLGPGQPTGHDSHADPLSPIELIQIKSPESGKRLYTFGTVRYEDAFGKGRFTNFCYFAEWKVGTERYTISIHPTQEHNNAN